MTPGNRRVEPAEAPADAVAPLPLAAAPKRGVLATLRAILGVVLVASASTGVAWTLRNHVMNSPRFAVTAIDVAGNDRRTAATLIGESGLTLGANIFSADLDGARARILADPWVMEASLVRQLPATIRVRVSERKAAALVALGDTFLATAAGEPFKKVDPEDPLDLPLVTGLRPESLSEDQAGAEATIRRAIDLAAEYGRGELGKRAPLQEVHIAADGAFTVVVGHNAVEIVLGGPPFRRKLDQAARVMAELDHRGAKADVIMLDDDARPERVVVRMR